MTNQTDPLDDLLKLLKRIASPDEIVGLGVTEEMTGPAAAEMNHRMKVAAKLSKELPAAINAEIAKAMREARIDEVQRLLEPGGYTDGDGMREQMRDRLTDLRELP